MRIQHRSAQRHSIFRGSIAYPTQLLCTLRSGRHLPPRNTRYEAAAKPYLGRTFHRLEHASLLGALAAYLLQRMNTLDCEWVSCRRITVLGRPLRSRLVFVPVCPECPVVLKTLAVYDTCPQPRNPIVLRQRVNPAISMFCDHPAD
jgi:hypothetical protein